MEGCPGKPRSAPSASGSFTTASKSRLASRAGASRRRYHSRQLKNVGELSAFWPRRNFQSDLSRFYGREEIDEAMTFRFGNNKAFSLRESARIASHQECD